MDAELLILIAEAIIVYVLVLWAHSLRHQFGLVHFYALIGGLTAVMSWVTDAGMAVQAGKITFFVGSTVFYTSLMLGVFVIYVFDGPKITRLVIYAIVGVSAMVPLIAMSLHMHHALINDTPLRDVPMPSLRINGASVIATMVDLIFLAIVWDFLGKHRRLIRLCMRTFGTLLGVMWIDVLIFTTLAFFGTENYVSILQGSLIARFVVTVFAFPILYLYIRLERRRKDVRIVNRPVLSILKEKAEIEEELSEAQKEIQLRIAAEAKLQKALSEVKTLKGMIPICAGCKSIRNDDGYWERIESYILNQTDAQFSHGICPDCQKIYYPELEDVPDDPA